MQGKQDTAQPVAMTAQDAQAPGAGRRQFFRVGGLFAAGLAASSALAPVASWAGTPSTSTAQDIAILNTALGLEYQAIAAYQVGAESGLLQKPVLDVAVKFQSQHKAHAEVLSSTIGKLGGTPVMAKKPSEYGFPVASLKTQADVLEFAAGLEKGAASAYLGAVPQFHNKDLAKAAASIMGDETMHWAVLLGALGKDPVPAAFIA
ncbi:ferritin-like domain-containing protein [Thiomonas bhubaneswarensis]|uniref:Ferritin-like domain n=1 Tax=Thiomonas bhubaneswarensis TaxID=339866 RepID=A0A0K6HQT9_9BURK|nr:Ferritin-like domain [Thiomonas bhubaneswarensis]